LKVDGEKAFSRVGGTSLGGGPSLSLFGSLALPPLHFFVSLSLFFPSFWIICFDLFGVFSHFLFHFLVLGDDKNRNILGSLSFANRSFEFR
jgi:hypothetical protein